MPSEFELESLPGTVKVIIDRAAASGLKRFSKAFWAPNIPEIQAATFEEPKNKIDAAYLAPEYTRDWILKVSKKLSELRRAYINSSENAEWVRGLKQRDMIDTIEKFLRYLFNGGSDGEDDEEGNDEVGKQVVIQGNGPVGAPTANQISSSVSRRNSNTQAIISPHSSAVSNSQAVKLSKRQAVVLPRKAPDLTLLHSASQSSSVLSTPTARGVAAEPTDCRLYQEPCMEEIMAQAISKAGGCWKIFGIEIPIHEILLNPHMLTKLHVEALSIYQSQYPEILLVGEVYPSVGGGMFLLSPTQYYAQTHQSFQAVHPELGQIEGGPVQPRATSARADPMDLDGKLDPLLSQNDKSQLASNA